MKIVIIEDESLIADQLAAMISEIAPEVTLLAKLSSLKNASKWFSSNPQPDLAFLDIQLSDGVSFELFEKHDITCPIIFTTAYNDYAIRAFKVNSIDYLVKPIDKNELRFAIEKFKKLKIAETVSTENIGKLVKDFANPSTKKYKQRFLVHVRQNLVPVEASQIATIYREEIIYLQSFANEKWVADFHSIEELEELLDPKLFFRANRQYILNINAVESFKADYSGKLFVKLISPINSIVDVSRLKASDFRAWVSKEDIDER